MPKQPKKPEVPGEQEDGSFDLSDVTSDPDELTSMYDEEGSAGAGDEDADEVIEIDAATAALIEQLQLDRDEALEARKRAMADLVNYRRRADENEIRARHDGVVGIVRSLIPVLDQLDLALAQSESDLTVEQLLEGVLMIRDELRKALENHVVSLILPAVREEFDPNQHQAVMRELTDELPPNTIAEVIQVGYAVGDTVVRPATVKVAVPADAEL